MPRLTLDARRSVCFLASLIVFVWAARPVEAEPPEVQVEEVSWASILQDDMAPAASSENRRSSSSPSSRSSSSGRRSRSSFRRSNSRLARTPDLFGDAFGTGSIVANSRNDMNAGSITADLPWAGSSRPMKIGEHNKALPQDRAYFTYHHFHNGLNAVRRGPGGNVVSFNSASINRIMLGLEKSLLDGNLSVEIRMPFSDEQKLVSEADPLTGPDFFVEGGGVGNLGVILKGLLLSDEQFAISAGVGLNTPTGSNAFVLLPQQFQPVEIEIRNQALHVSPFVGFLAAPNDRWFAQGFAQVDFATSSNPIEVAVADSLFDDSGRFTEQTVLYLDGSLGVWLDRDTSRPYLTGIAALIELHYSTALQNTDVVPLPFNLAAINNARNRYDVLNLTTGLHLQITEQSALRVGAVLPLKDGDNRFFDGEFTLAFIRKL